MVTRKPLPEHAAYDSAVPEHARDVWSPGNLADDTVWRDGAVRHHQKSQHQGSNIVPAPVDVPNVLRPGAVGNCSDAGADTNVWAEGAPALTKAEETMYEQEADTLHRVEAGPESLPVPAVLQPAGGAHKLETNPFKRKMSLSASGPGGQATARKQPTTPEIPPLPPVPVEELSQLSLNDASTNPWQPSLDDTGGVARPPVLKLPDQDSVSDNVWASAKPSRQPTPGPRSTSPTLLSLPSEEGSAGWEDETKKSTTAAPLITTADDGVLEDAHAWDDLKTLDKGKGPAQPPTAPNAGPSGGSDDWNLIDLDTRPEPLSRQSTWENFKDESDGSKKAPPAVEGAAEGAAPQLPPRRSAELPPAKPPRPVDKSETYQIKKITWHDATAAHNPRTSPILVQNANGPCPLVALVNALSLTTPADRANTALVETLKSREQVSLGLLLDAVFDELMSERRTQPDVPLPDVTELYDFLKGLHTGMNVNPRFIPAPEVVTAFKRTSLTHLHPTERTDMIPGTFEHTREMALYSTFSIPLIHGWLPSRDDPVYGAFSRQAASYEDAQNLLFREEELEEKLCSQHQGLSAEEQQMYQDILTIKSFLSISATQLTRFGLDVIRKAMKPGSVAILFRNDHFSTLYRHPQTLELLTLVTDAGYAGHAEVVWESLVDVNGESAEFFSGDFRVVGGASHAQAGPSQDADLGGWTDGADAVDGDDSGWTTVQGRRGGRSQTAQHSASTEPPLSPKHEQEDRDLALALQLQEEEDERARAEHERRRRESLLSEQYIEQQGRSGPAAGNARVGGRTRGASHSSTSLASSGSGSTAAAVAAGRRTTPAQPSVSRSSNGSNTRRASTGAAPGSASNAGRPRPTMQTVRSLIPPVTATTAVTTAPTTPRSNSTTTSTATTSAGAGRSTSTTTTSRGTNRPADEGLDDAPPSYEQAAKQTPYVPPAGHPSHPASSPAAAAAAAASEPRSPGLGLPQGMAQGPRQGIGMGRGGGAYPGGQHPQQHQPQQQGFTGGGGGGGGFTPTGLGGFRRGGPPPRPPAQAVQAQGGKERECVVM